MELKHILQEMGDTLVSTYGFKKANLSGGQCLDHSTAPIVQFLIWLDSTPEAKAVLSQMGYAPRPQTPQVAPFRIAQ